jgi:cytosine/adenosine deaminase-related metal-dependent hydrolase
MSEHPMTPEQIAAALTEAQRRALLAFSDDDDSFPGHYAKANELGASGNTLASLANVGGVDPITLLHGPILVTPEYTREGTFWQITALGLAVRKLIEESRDA